MDSRTGYLRYFSIVDTLRVIDFAGKCITVSIAICSFLFIYYNLQVDKKITIHGFGPIIMNGAAFLLVIPAVVLLLRYFSSHSNNKRNLTDFIFAGLVFLSVPMTYFIYLTLYYIYQAIFNDFQLLMRYPSEEYPITVYEMVFPIIFGWILIFLLLILIGVARKKYVLFHQLYEKYHELYPATHRG